MRMGGSNDAFLPCSCSSSSANPRRSIKFKPHLLSLSSILLLLLLLPLPLTQSQHQSSKVVDFEDFSSGPNTWVLPRGVSEGVSEKSVPIFLRTEQKFPRTNDTLTWQRTAFHFQPEKNWMNDPDGPLFYKGWYHLFYQYNPDSAIWGNITWGHAVSRDLIHWHYLPPAMVPDQWYDINGVWTGSATFLPNGSIVMLYTGSTHQHVQVQNLAFPADPSDPLLLNWVKYSNNPILLPRAGPGFFEAQGKNKN